MHIIDIPQLLPPTKTSDNSAAGDSIPRTPAAVFIPAPGMALTHATQFEPLLIPRFLNSAARQTQHASDGNAFRTSGLAVTRGRVAERGSKPDETEFQHDEPRDHRVGIEPERDGSVIPFKRANNVATGADEC